PLRVDTLLSFPHELLPLLLLGITDETEKLGKSALELVEAVGRTFEARKATARAAKRAAKAADSGAQAEEDEAVMETDAMDVEMEPTVPLLPPFTGRPGAGCRHLVQQMLKELLKPVLQDVKEWTVALRTAAARQLYTLVLLAEGKMEDFLDTILPALCSAVSDDAVDVATRVVAATHSLGSNIPVRSWMPLMLDAVKGEQVRAQSRASGLVVMAALLRTANAASMPDDLILEMADVLACKELRTSDHPAVRRQLFAATTNLVCGSHACRPRHCAPPWSAVRLGADPCCLEEQ
ncbi:HEAT repeat-containing protein 2, partial [Cymbomonas tetramitiformis]